MSAYRDSLPAETLPRYDEAIQRAAVILGHARARRDSLPVEQAAAAAYIPGGPTIPELIERITRDRAEARSELLRRSA